MVFFSLNDLNFSSRCMADGLLEHAYQISKDVISKNDGKLGIYAGGTHFREYWSRDSLFTIFGSAYTHPKLSRKNLQTFIDYQSEEGQIPLTLSEFHRILRSFGVERKLSKLFFRHNYPFGGKTQDSNLLFIIAFDEYIKRSRDKEFLLANIDSISKASRWSIRWDEGNLIKEGRIANWMDTLLYSGYSMYTNVLYYKSMLSLAYLFEQAGLSGGDVYIDKSNIIREAIDKQFWRGDHYARWSDNDDFTGSGNALAMMFGVPDDDKVIKIMKYIEGNNLDFQPLMEADKAIPIRRRRKVPSMLGMYEYWNNPWPWIGCAYVAGLTKSYPEKAREVINKIAQTVVHNGTTLEIVNRNGNLGRAKIYRSERDFSWTAGMYIYAYENLVL